MSHFTVLVSIKDATEDSLNKALQPFHEYECTGEKDEHVVFVPGESLDDMKAEHDRQLKKYPESTSEIFDVFVDDWYGYELKEGVWGEWTNPNKKWDWWTVGGRWSNMLINKKGERGNIFVKSDIDFDLMKSESVKIKLPNYEKAQEAFGGESFVPWGEMIKDESITREEQIDRYNKQPAVMRFKEAFSNPFVSAEEFFFDRDSFIKKCEFEGISTFAILHNGKWIERGDMGWWGCVSNERSDWEDTFNKALNEIPDDYYLVVVDCHI